MNGELKECQTDEGLARLGPGRLVLVVGPSGAGKDTLMNALRDSLRGDPSHVFARRLITRTTDGATEDHDAIGREEFDTVCREGRVALSWEAHGLGYILPESIDADIRSGHTVIANGSRQILDQARRKYASVVILLVTAPIEVLAERLSARGRESREEIRRRLSRAEVNMPDVPGVIRIDNSGELSVSLASMRQALGLPAASR
jgi:ribose 1,5-bisphosphokinase